MRKQLIPFGVAALVATALFTFAVLFIVYAPLSQPLLSSQKVSSTRATIQSSAIVTDVVPTHAPWLRQIVHAARAPTPPVRAWLERVHFLQSSHDKVPSCCTLANNVLATNCTCLTSLAEKCVQKYNLRAPQPMDLAAVADEFKAQAAARATATAATASSTFSLPIPPRPLRVAIFADVEYSLASFFRAIMPLQQLQRMLPAAAGLRFDFDYYAYSSQLAHAMRRYNNAFASLRSSSSSGAENQTTQYDVCFCAKCFPEQLQRTFTRARLPCAALVADVVDGPWLADALNKPDNLEAFDTWIVQNEVHREHILAKHGQSLDVRAAPHAHTHFSYTPNNVRNCAADGSILSQNNNNNNNNANDRPLIVGFIGSPEHMLKSADVARLRAALAALNAQLRLINYEAVPEIPMRLPFPKRQPDNLWRQREHHLLMSGVDVALVHLWSTASHPRTADEDRGRPATRLVSWLAHGVPTVYPSVPLYTSVLREHCTPANSRTLLSEDDASLLRRFASNGTIEHAIELLSVLLQNTAARCDYVRIAQRCAANFDPSDYAATFLRNLCDDNN